MGQNIILNEPGSGWAKLAAIVAERLPRPEIDQVWVFRSVRRAGKEWGTAILSRVDANGQRRRLYTARFVHTLKGKERGQFSAAVQEVGSGPVEALPGLVAGVERRLDDDAATAVAPDIWFGPLTDGAPRQG